jgi:hypothetical protein
MGGQTGRAHIYHKASNLQSQVSLAGGRLTDVGLASTDSTQGEPEPGDDDDGDGDGDGNGDLGELVDGAVGRAVCAVGRAVCAVGRAVQGTQDGLGASTSISTIAIAVGADQ